MWIESPFCILVLASGLVIDELNPIYHAKRICGGNLKKIRGTCWASATQVCLRCHCVGSGWYTFIARGWGKLCWALCNAPSVESQETIPHKVYWRNYSHLAWRRKDSVDERGAQDLICSLGKKDENGWSQEGHSHKGKEDNSKECLGLSKDKKNLPGLGKCA